MFRVPATPLHPFLLPEAETFDVGEGDVFVKRGTFSRLDLSFMK